MDFSIRPARLADAELMIAVSAAARGVVGSDPVGAITDPNRCALVVNAGGQVVGWGKTHFYEEPSGAAPEGHYLGGVNVLPNFQRRGIGTALTRARLEWIFDRNTDAWFFTNARNAASIALHRSLGFVEVARATEFHGTSFDGGAGILYRAVA